MEIKGIVEQVSTKDVTTKFGTKKTYSVKVNGSWISAGFKDPKVNTGDEIVCEADTTAYGLQTKALAKTGSTGSVPAAPAPSAPGRSTFSPGGKVFPVPALHGDRSIIRQNVLARATELYIAARGGKPFEFDEESTSIIISFARKLEAYAAGDLDAIAAAEAMKQAGLSTPE